MEGALDARLMAGEAIELGLKFVIVEQVSIGGEARAEVGFHAADSAKVPGGGDQLIEEGLLKRALGRDVGLESGEQFVEFFAILGADDEVFGRESVLAGVLRGGGFALRRPGTGAELCVGSVGGLAGRRMQT